MNVFTHNSVTAPVELRSVYSTMLLLANNALCVSAVSFAITILISYPYASYFSLPIQILAHISTILLAAIFKVSYVMRCVAQHALGQEVR